MGPARNHLAAAASREPQDIREETPSPPPPRVNILGVGVSVLTIPLAVRIVADRIKSRLPGYICVRDVNGVVLAQDDPAFRAIHNHSLLTTPDGMPLVWLGRRQGHPAMERVYGPDLMRATCERSVSEGWKHYLYGGAEGVAEQLRDALIAAYPGIQIVGTACPPYRPLTEEEKDSLQREVAAAAPDILWVGLGTPKQERFMAEHCPRLGVPVLIGVGAAFDFLTGRVRQAPRWIQRSGFEWLFRLTREPRRLFWRYAVVIPRFIWLATLQALGWKRYRID